MEKGFILNILTIFTSLYKQVNLMLRLLISISISIIYNMNLNVTDLVNEVGIKTNMLPLTYLIYPTTILH